MELEVEVVYALPGAADAVRVRLPAGATLLDAVRASGVLGRHPELRDGTLKLGVYGKPSPAGQAARPGDRVEIYRELAADPKEARRRRAKRRGRATRV